MDRLTHSQYHNHYISKIYMNVLTSLSHCIYIYIYVSIPPPSRVQSFHQAKNHRMFRACSHHHKNFKTDHSSTRLLLDDHTRICMQMFATVCVNWCKSHLLFIGCYSVNVLLGWESACSSVCSFCQSGSRSLRCPLREVKSTQGNK